MSILHSQSGGRRPRGRQATGTAAAGDADIASLLLRGKRQQSGGCAYFIYAY